MGDVPIKPAFVELTWIWWAVKYQGAALAVKKMMCVAKGSKNNAHDDSCRKTAFA